jgi:hypothetical protein
MTAKTQTCVTIDCDVCGDKFEGDFVYHFDTIGHAQDAASNEQWFIADDGRALCPAWRVKPTEHLRTGDAWLPNLSESERDSLLEVYPQLGPDYYGSDEERAEALGAMVESGSAAK